MVMVGRKRMLEQVEKLRKMWGMIQPRAFWKQDLMSPADTKDDLPRDDAELRLKTAKERLIQILEESPEEETTLSKSPINGFQHLISNWFGGRKRRSLFGQCERRDLLSTASLVGISMIDLWFRAQEQDDPGCVALDFCKANRGNTRAGIHTALARQVSQVLSRGAAFIIGSSRGFETGTLEEAAALGLNGPYADCEGNYSCNEAEHSQ